MKNFRFKQGEWYLLKSKNYGARQVDLDLNLWFLLQSSKCDDKSNQFFHQVRTKLFDFIRLFKVKIEGLILKW